MDMQMPIMDWVTALGTDAPYIVALTVNVYEEDKQKCFDSGMKDFLTKPIILDNLKDAISTYQNFK
jgi:CheY-like chemotaxis protein